MHYAIPKRLALLKIAATVPMIWKDSPVVLASRRHAAAVSKVAPKFDWLNGGLRGKQKHWRTTLLRRHDRMPRRQGGVAEIRP